MLLCRALRSDAGARGYYTHPLPHASVPSPLQQSARPSVCPSFSTDTSGRPPSPSPGSPGLQPPQAHVATAPPDSAIWREPDGAGITEPVGAGWGGLRGIKVRAKPEQPFPLALQGGEAGCHNLPSPSPVTSLESPCASVSLRVKPPAPGSGPCEGHVQHPALSTDLTLDPGGASRHGDKSGTFTTKIPGSWRLRPAGRSGRQR